MRCTVLGLSVFFVMACSSGPERVGAPDAGGSDAGGTTSIGDAGSEHDSARMASDTASAVDARFPGVEPLPGPATVRLVTGRAQLLGAGTDACTNEPGSRADRWCAFSQPGMRLGETELWVIDVSVAARSGPPPCDGTSPHCVRLTSRLWTEQPPDGPTYPYDHRFDGDTLIFHGNALSASDEPFRGEIFAWRPGWAAPRRIAVDALTCVGHRQAPAAYCITNLSPDTAPSFTFDIHAGPLAENAPDLPRIDRILPIKSNDIRAWRAGFSPDGRMFAYSTGVGDRVTDPEILRVIRTASLGDPAAVKTLTSPGGAARFVWSADSERIFYLRDYNYSAEGAPSGAAMVVRAATLTDPVQIQANAALVNTHASGAVYTFTDVTANRGTVWVLRPSGAGFAPTKVGDRFTSVLMAPDLMTAAVSTTFSEETGFADAWLAKTDGTEQRCALETKTSTQYFGPAFSRDLRLVFWAADIDPTIFIGNGWLADARDCSKKMQFATGVDFWYMLGPRVVLYSDDGDGSTSTLRVLRWDEGGWPTPGGRTIRAGIDRYFAPLLEHDAVVFQVAGGPAAGERGIYLVTGLSK